MKYKLLFKEEKAQFFNGQTNNGDIHTISVVY